MRKSARLILQQQYLPADHDKLLAAFRALDPDNTGHIGKEEITQLFMEEGEPFSQVFKKTFFILR